MFWIERGHTNNKPGHHHEPKSGTDTSSGDVIDQGHHPLEQEQAHHDQHDNDGPVKKEAQHQHCSAASDQQQVKLQSAMEELEQERSRRQNLEEQIATLKEQQKQQQKQLQHQQAKKRRSAHHPVVARKELVALQAEVQGYRQIVDALTMGRPAVDAAVAALEGRKFSSSNTSPTAPRFLMEPNVLPLHVVRFLELMPWHPLAQEAASVTEEVYEWQVYHADKRDWRSELGFFPTFFKALPVIQPEVVDHDVKIGVWTNQTLTQRFDLKKGYFLPNNDASVGPSWKWIGGWYVDTDTDEETPSSFLDVDGWAYAKEAGHLLDTTGLNLIPPASLQARLEAPPSTDRHPHDLGRSTMVRRRKWARRRVLMDYPMASEATVNYLSMKAHGEELLLTNKVLTSHVKETQQTLQDMESKHDKDYQMWDEERAKLEARLAALEVDEKHTRAEKERQRGPPIKGFSFIAPLKTLDDDDDSSSSDDDDDDSTISGCSDTVTCTSRCDTEDEVASALKHLDEVLLLQPEHDVVDKSTSFFGWGNKSNATTTPAEPVPEAEICSDDNCSDTEEDDSERVMEDGELDGLAVPSSSVDEYDEGHKGNFLQKLFFKPSTKV